MLSVTSMWLQIDDKLACHSLSIRKSFQLPKIPSTLEYNTTWVGIRNKKNILRHTTHALKYNFTYTYEYTYVHTYMYVYVSHGIIFELKICYRIEFLKDLSKDSMAQRKGVLNWKWFLKALKVKVSTCWTKDNLSQVLQATMSTNSMVVVVVVVVIVMCDATFTFQMLKLQGKGVLLLLTWKD